MGGALERRSGVRGGEAERQTGTCLRGKSQEKKTISVSLTVQLTVRTSPCFNTLLDAVRSTSITLGTRDRGVSGDHPPLQGRLPPCPHL